MAGFGNLENPYVENPFAGRIVNVHWRTPSHVVGGTLEGLFSYSWGFGAIDIQVGIIDENTGAILGSSSVASVSVDTRVPLNASASGTILTEDTILLAPFVQISGDHIDFPGLYYFFHPPGFAFFSAPISNTGDLSPFGQHVGVTGPGHWTCDISFTAVVTGTTDAGGAGIINVVLTPL